MGWSAILAMGGRLTAYETTDEEEAFCETVRLFIMNPDLTVQQYLSSRIAEIGEKLSIRRFQKYVMGEGLEKRADDFAAEVASMVK